MRPRRADGAGQPFVALPGQQHHVRVRLLPAQLLGGLDAVHPGHVQVHQHHVGTVHGGFGDGLGAVDGLADHRQAGALERPADARAQRCAVVDDQHPKSGGGAGADARVGHPTLAKSTGGYGG
jgi:hypothetical protein